MSRFKNLIQNTPIEKLFLLLAVPSTILFILVIPPLQGWDEATHFLRTYQISTGDLMSEKYGKRAGGSIPVNVVNMNDGAIYDIMESAKTDLHRKVNIHYFGGYIKINHPSEVAVNKYFAGSAVYSPVSYAPQSLGIFIARTVRLPILSYDYAARFFGAIAFIAMVYWAIKLTPRGKWAILTIAMLPTSLAAAGTLSPDALVNGGALLLVALVLRGIFAKERLSLKYLLAMAGVIALLSLTKQAYFLFAFLPLFIPAKNAFGSVKKYLLWNFAFIFLALASTLGWYSQVSDIAKYSYLDSRPSAHISSSEQVSYIIHHPVNYLSTFFSDALIHTNSEYIQIGGVLTWKGIVMPFAAIFLIYFGLLLSLLITRQEHSVDISLSKLQRRVSAYGPLLIGLALVCLIYLALYISFNSVGAQKIEGVQGRYFIPLIALLVPALALAKHKYSAINFNKDKFPILLTSIIIAQTVIALFVIFATNYIPNIQFV